MPSDVRGLKIRVPELPVLIETWKALGANPVPLGIDEVFVGLRQGTIDGQENPVEVTVSQGFHEIQKYLVLLGYSRAAMSVLVNEEVWQRLTPEDQEILVETWKEIRDENEEVVREQEQELIAQAEEAGMVVIEPDVDAFRAATEDVWTKVAPELWGEGVYEQIVETR